MPRVVPSDVLAIRPSTLDPMPFILTATVVVDVYLGSVGLPALQLAEIERWLAAHFLEVAEPSLVAKRLGDTSVTMDKMKLGEALNGTRYGQQVLLLDTSGTLSQVAGTEAVGIKRATILVD
jgi:hypothetical protein